MEYVNLNPEKNFVFLFFEWLIVFDKLEQT